MSRKTKIDQAIELTQYEIDEKAEEITIKEAERLILVKKLEQLETIKKQGTNKDE